MISSARLIAPVLIAAYAIFYWAGGVFATQNAAPVPLEVAISLPQARSLGTARLKVWGFEVYDAQLWATAEFSAPEYAGTPFALQLRYLRNFEGAAIAERSIKEMRGIGSFADAQAAQWLEQMRAIFPNVRKGDRLLGVHQPGVGASFVFNGKPVGELRDPEFARLFFGIWLSSQTSQPHMRRDLLGLPAPDKP
jgi:Chalcone isomerase-like